MFLTAEQLLAEFRGNAPCERAIIEQTEKSADSLFPMTIKIFCYGKTADRDSSGSSTRCSGDAFGPTDG
jgi:hypothetical protein